jgi:hypothetical protein
MSTGKMRFHPRESQSRSALASPVVRNEARHNQSAVVASTIRMPRQRDQECVVPGIYFTFPWNVDCIQRHLLNLGYDLRDDNRHTEPTSHLQTLLALLPQDRKLRVSLAPNFLG